MALNLKKRTKIRQILQRSGKQKGRKTRNRLPQHREQKVLPLLFRWQPQHLVEAIAEWLPLGEVACGSRPPTGAGELASELAGAGVCNQPGKAAVAWVGRQAWRYIADNSSPALPPRTTSEWLR